MAATRTNLELLVGFIDYEDSETDTGLSFAIYEDGEYTDSLMLARSSFDRLLTDEEQGVRISYGDVLDCSMNPILLQEANLQDALIELTCKSHRFALDLSKLDDADVKTIISMLTKLNFDKSFVLRINGREQKADISDKMIVPCCWYQPEEWLKPRDSATDAEKHDDTYEDWKKNANDMIRFVQLAGRKVQKVNIKIEDLEAWCMTEGRENNSAALSHYATAKARQRSSNRSRK